MSPGYSYLTLGAARTELAARLEDNGRPGQLAYVYWTVPELNSFIVEAVRTWQALTSYYKARTTFDINLNDNAFFDLRNTDLLYFSVTDEQIVNRALAALLEPPLTATWVGTGQFDFRQITDALQNRINRWLSDTGANVTRNIQNMGTGPSAARVFLPEGVLDVRRAAWRNSVGEYFTLWRDDEWAMQSFKYFGFAKPADPPTVWGKFTIPPVGVEVYPPPANPGDLETLVVESGPQIGTTPAEIVNSPTVLDIPEDFTYGMVFGALSDLLSADGQMRDPDRAAYCEQRYQESTELYRLNPTLLASRVDEVPVWTGSVFEMDSFLASWQAKPGQPRFAAMAGRNLVAFGPVPDGLYSATIDVVANIPVPVSDSDYIQVDRGSLNTLLDYAVHLACFKMAGTEFKGKDKCRMNFYIAAALENRRITQMSFYRQALELPAMRQEREVPRIGRGQSPRVQSEPVDTRSQMQATGLAQNAGLNNGGTEP